MLSPLCCFLGYSVCFYYPQESSWCMSSSRSDSGWNPKDELYAFTTSSTISFTISIGVKHLQYTAVSGATYSVIILQWEKPVLLHLKREYPMYNLMSKKGNILEFPWFEGGKKSSKTYNRYDQNYMYLHVLIDFTFSSDNCLWNPLKHPLLSGLKGETQSA